MNNQMISHSSLNLKSKKLNSDSKHIFQIDNTTNSHVHTNASYKLITLSLSLGSADTVRLNEINIIHSECVNYSDFNYYCIRTLYTTTTNVLCVIANCLSSITACKRKKKKTKRITKQQQ